MCVNTLRFICAAYISEHIRLAALELFKILKTYGLLILFCLSLKYDQKSAPPFDISIKYAQITQHMGVLVHFPILNV